MQPMPATSTAGSLQLVNQAAQNLQNIPAVSNASIPSLANDIAMAQQHAANWTSQLGPQVSQVVQSTISFGPTFQNAYAQLQQLASQIESGTASAVAPFQTQLANLSNSVSAIQQAVHNVNGPLLGFQGDLSGDQRSLTDDVSSAQVQITVLQGKANQVQQQLNQVNAQLAAKNSPSGITVRIMEDISTLGLAEMTNNQSQLENQANQYSQQLQQLNSTLQGIQSAQQEAAAFAGAVSNLQASISGFTTQWDQFVGDFNEVNTNATVNSTFLGPALQAMDANWNDLLSQANELSGQ